VYFSVLVLVLNNAKLILIKNVKRMDYLLMKYVMKDLKDMEKNARLLVLRDTKIGP